ncbi:MAG: AraC family transcriptional regulator [Lachnospiraceae bacterium]|nr:AraC family transcriptional regulator [Lachnospiraceae bacterium]
MIEILHGERETVIYDEFLKIRAYLNVEEVSYPSHWQPSFEIIMPIQGNYEVTVNETRLLLVPEDILLIPPGILHRIAKPASEGSRYILLFDPDLFIQVPGMQNLYKAFLPYAFFHPAKENDRTGKSDMGSMISGIYRWNATGHRLRYAHIYSLLLNFLLEASSRFTPASGSGALILDPSRDTADRLQNACRFIENNIAKDLRPAEIAEMCGFSESHFLRLFRQYTNMPFKKYVNSCRITSARYMLASNVRASVTDICLQCGFPSISTFNRLFKESVGHSPTEFRRLQRSNEWGHKE